MVKSCRPVLWAPRNVWSFRPGILATLTVSHVLLMCLDIKCTIKHLNYSSIPWELWDIYPVSILTNADTPSPLRRRSPKDDLLSPDLGVL